MHTSSQKIRKLEEEMREVGCVVSGGYYPQIHHPMGRKGMHAKQLIGPYFMIPLSVDMHMATSKKISIHNNKREFIERYGNQVNLWLKAIGLYERLHGKPFPVPVEIKDAIKGCGK